MKSITRVLLGVCLLLVLTPAVPPESAGKIVDRFYDGYNQGSVDAMLSTYSADAVFEDVNQRHRYEGTDQLAGMLTQIVQIHREMQVVEIRRVVSGNVIVVEYEYRGELNGEVLSQMSGKTCPDLTYVLPATSWFEVKNGKIVNQKDFIDHATFLELRQKMLAAGSASTSHGSHN